MIDIEDRKQAEEKLRRNETDLMEARALRASCSTNATVFGCCGSKQSRRF